MNDLDCIREYGQAVSFKQSKHHKFLRPTIDSKDCISTAVEVINFFGDTAIELLVRENCDPQVGP